MIGKSSTLVLNGRAFGREFLAALQAAGGHLGKGPAST
jgi:hypothetical protein